MVVHVYLSLQFTVVNITSPALHFFFFFFFFCTMTVCIRLISELSPPSHRSMDQAID